MWSITGKEASSVLIKMQIPWPFSRPTISEVLEMRPSNCIFKRCSVILFASSSQKTTETDPLRLFTGLVAENEKRSWVQDKLQFSQYNDFPSKCKP